MESQFHKELLLSTPLMFAIRAQSSGGISPTTSDGSRVQKPSSAIFLAILFSAIAFASLASICIKRYVSGAPSMEERYRYLRSAATCQAKGSHGLEKSLIESFPVLRTLDLKFREAGKECAVCLSELKDDQSLRLLPACNHFFHKACIDTWLASHVTCPVCRADLEDQSSPADEGGPVERSCVIEIPMDELGQLQATGHSLNQFRPNSPENSTPEYDDVDGLPKEWSLRAGFRGKTDNDEGASEDSISK